MAGFNATTRRAQRRFGPVLGAAAAVLTGCSSGLKVTPEMYRGPTVTSAAASGVHMILAQMPSPGWALEIDATRESAERTDVYLTLRRPNPAAIYPQRVVEQRAVTRVDESESLGIVARVLDYTGDRDTAYRRVR